MAPDRPAADAGRYSRKRALVLLLVHVAIALHIAHWKLSGRTLAPLELNEVVYTLELGIVTAGFLLMLLAFLSSVAFGRFFCSWGCHIVALQDGAAWLLRKLGIKPRPVRSRLLALGPYVVLGYMFVWPQIERVSEGRSFPGFRVAGDAEGWASFITEDFWRNLPGIGVIVSTFLIVGLVMVWVLGTRAFCRYACPYGAAFALADRISPTRIRAVKPCTGCGVCTAACDSQVRVHEEIGRFGMIVDPNCLRDLDCVAVCPENGLSVGPARPSLLRRVIADVEVRHLYDFSWAEELLAAGVAVATTVALRGLYGVVPFFMSIGVGILTAWIVVALVRLARRRPVTFARVALVEGRRLRLAGWCFAILGAGWIVFLGHSGYVQWHTWAGLRAHARHEPSALGHLDRVNRAGLFPSPRAIKAAFELHHASAKQAFDKGDAEGAMDHLEAMIGLDPGSVAARCELGALLVEAGNPTAAVRRLEEAVRLDPRHADSQHNLGVALMQLGAVDEALRHAEEAVRLAPEDPKARGFRDHLLSLRSGR